MYLRHLKGLIFTFLNNKYCALHVKLSCWSSPCLEAILFVKLPSQGQVSSGFLVDKDGFWYCNTLHFGIPSWYFFLAFFVFHCACRSCSLVSFCRVLFSFSCFAHMFLFVLFCCFDIVFFSFEDVCLFFRSIMCSCSFLCCCFFDWSFFSSTFGGSFSLVVWGPFLLVFLSTFSTRGWSLPSGYSLLPYFGPSLFFGVR